MAYTRCLFIGAAVLLSLALVQVSWAGSGDFSPPAYHKTFFQLSKDKPNVVIIVLDMFTGGHIPQLMDSTPGLKEQFAGFTWYPDTLAEANSTIMSMPAVLGGAPATVDKLNARQGALREQAVREALLFLPKTFQSKGFTAVFVGTPIPELKFVEKHVSPLSFLALPGLDPAYTRLWNEMIQAPDPGQQSPARFFLTTALFRVAPHLLKKQIHDQGSWLGADTDRWRSEQIHTLSESALLGLLPRFTTADSPTSTLKIIYSQLPHNDWYLPEHSLVPVPDPYPLTKGQLVKENGVFPEHIMAERHTLRLLGAWFDTLRALGCFDNTQIILVSDHCGGDSAMLNAALGMPEQGLDADWEAKRAYPGRPHALLMHKERGANTPLHSSPALMSNADTVALVCAANGGCEGIGTVPDSSGRVRTHLIGNWQWNNHPKDSFTIDSRHTVRGSLFRKENWQ